MTYIRNFIGSFKDQISILFFIFFLGALHAQTPLVITPEMFVTLWEVDAGETITIPLQSGTYNFDYVWEFQNTIDPVSGNTITESGTHMNIDGDFETTFAEAGMYKLAITGEFPHMRNYPKVQLLEVLQWGDIQWESMIEMFENWPGEGFMAIDTPDLSNVTSLVEMFRGAAFFNDDLNHWNVSNVTFMTNLFVQAKLFNGNIRDWDMSNVISTRSMFNGASAFNQDISDWDVSNVKDMFLMFAGASSFNQPIGAWDVSKVERMERLFSGASSFNQSLGAWQFNRILRKNAADRTNRILDNTNFDCQNWSSTLIGWDFNNPSLDSMFINANFQYDTIAAVAFDSLIARGWNISGTLIMDNCNAEEPCDNDLRAPMIEALPDILGECQVTLTEVPIAIDLCQGDITGTTTDPLTYDVVGTYIVTWVFDDGVGNIYSVEQKVIVSDETDPIPDLPVLPNRRGQCSLSLSGEPAPTAMDNCEGVITATTEDPLDYEEQGTFIITWIFDDGNGNVVEQDQNIIVRDINAPIPDVSPLPVLFSCGEVNVTTIPTATDACEGVIMATTDDPLSYTEPGIFTITWTYDDGNGNTREQNQRIEVQGVDDLAPIPDLAMLPEVTGECSVTITTIPTATDNCSGIIMGTTSDPLTYNIPGTYTILWIFEDEEGNISEQEQTIMLSNPSALPITPEMFVTTWEVAAGETIRIPLQSGTYNFDYSWELVSGDCNNNIFGNHTNNEGGFETTFTEGGVYKLAITGAFPHLRNYPKDKLLDVIQWGDIKWGSLFEMFEGWQGISFSATDTIDLSQVTSMQETFKSASNFNDNINHWDVSTVTNMTEIFAGARSFNEDISSWNVGNVTQMGSAFLNARLFNKDIGNWNVGKVSNMRNMFAGATVFNQDIGNWNVSEVIAMQSMFNNASAFNQDISGWDVSNVISMQAMFKSAESFNQPIGAWDVRKVNTMREMLTRVGSFNQSLGAWQFNPIMRKNNGNRTLSIFSRTGMDCQSWSSTIVGWEFNNPGLDSMFLNGPNNVNIDTIARVAQEELIARGWTIRGTLSEDVTCISDDPCANDLRAPEPLTLPDVIGECSVTITEEPIAVDLCQGNITGTTSDPLIYNVPGTYFVTWVFDDGVGNIDSVDQRVILQEDNVAPIPDVVELPTRRGPCRIILNSGTTPTAMDNCAGVMTATTNDPLLYEEQGTYIVTWIYDDGNGNIVEQEQTIIVEDRTPPTIELIGSTEITLACGADTFIDSGATISDNCEGVFLVTTGTVDVNTPGIYELTYKAIDVGGNESEILTRTVTVIDSAICTCLNELVVTAVILAMDPHASIFTSDGTITIDGLITAANNEEILLSAPDGIEFLGTTTATFEVEQEAILEVDTRTCTEIFEGMN